ncbi:MAG: CBS domain-containing protein [Candidatus Cloacimonadales bacterium]|nr:CBS domain-containing protein [Candidatus Cloacimonadales bacterium]
MNKKLKILFKERGNVIHSVSGNTTIKKAVDIMNQHRIGALMVINFEGEIEGIFTERDVMKKLADTDELVGHLKVRDIMTVREDMIISNGNETMEEIMQLLAEKKIRHIPIVNEDGVLEGIISIRDIIRILLKDANQKVSQLNNYITGKYPA